MSATPFKLQRDADTGTAEQDSRRYLLFAGAQQPPNGGLCDLVDTFTSEEAARRAFREVRLRTASTTSWAQLPSSMAMTASGRCAGSASEPSLGGPGRRSPGRPSS